MQADAIMLLRSKQILKRIHENNLLEQSAEVGKYLLDRLRMLDNKIGNYGKTRSRGIGGLIFTSFNIVGVHATDIGRLLPPLSLTKNQVDQILSNPSLQYSDFCNKCSEPGELILCEGESCVLSFHLKCIGLKRKPQKNWYCETCRVINK